MVEIVEESEVGYKEDRDSGQLGSTKGSCPKRGRRVSFHARSNFKRKGERRHTQDQEPHSG